MYRDKARIIVDIWCDICHIIREYKIFYIFCIYSLFVRTNKVINNG